MKHLKNFKIFENENLNKYIISDDSENFYIDLSENDDKLVKISKNEALLIKKSISKKYDVDVSNNYYYEITIYNKKISEDKSARILKDQDDYYYFTVIEDHSMGDIFGPLYKFDQLDELLNNIEEVLKIELI